MENALATQQRMLFNQVKSTPVHEAYTKAENKIKKLLTFCGSSSDVADPWYTGDFDTTYRDVSEGCQALYNWILENQKLN